ncbi:hypothetical protein SDJN03_01271, partial [Cucurbita argyrosperma subsp. sororia]
MVFVALGVAPSFHLQNHALFRLFTCFSLQSSLEERLLPLDFTLIGVSARLKFLHEQSERVAKVYLGVFLTASCGSVFLRFTLR